jgi:hypothetical protein
MTYLKLTADQTVRRLRWVMVGVILFEMIITLFGQRSIYWRDSQAARQIDQGFDYFLSRGWPTYVFVGLIYLLGTFLFVSVLPRTTSSIAIFAFILSHYFAASNWLAIHWHFGIEAPIVYGIVLAAMIVLAAFPIPGISTDQIVNRLRWVMVGVIVFDFINTSLGQPASYWHHPQTVNESNGLWRFFLTQGYPYFCAFQLAYVAGTFLWVSILPRTTASICVLAFILGQFDGSSNWFYFRWQLGTVAPIIYGVILSAIMVSLIFPGSGKTNPSEKSFSDNLAGCGRVG